jgi:hypothetical protein
MKVILSLGILAALGCLAQAQEKPVPDLNKTPWSATTTERSDGLSGTSTTTIKREIGDGLSVGGQMKTPYQDPALGGSGPPANPVDSARSGNIILGPVLEKKF